MIDPGKGFLITEEIKRHSFSPSTGCLLPRYDPSNYYPSWDHEGSQAENETNTGQDQNQKNHKETNSEPDILLLDFLLHKGILFLTSKVSPG